ncbi:MAG: hypothetical protein Q8R55_02370, partial [Candidatus Taylorbacteria bacterium]|nr:hypothetical protein [Candidatus Taylorbacteria bacterium]
PDFGSLVAYVAAFCSTDRCEGEIHFQRFPVGKLTLDPDRFIEEELAKLGAELLIETLPKYIAEKIKPQEQGHSKATFTKLLIREDGKIDWNCPAQEIYNQIRALNPEPGTWTIWPSFAKASAGKKDKVLNILETDYLDAQLPSNLEVERPSPGTVVKVDNNIAVVTSKCYLILKQIQLEGGKEMDAKAFLNGHPDFLGLKLE